MYAVYEVNGAFKGIQSKAVDLDKNPEMGAIEITRNTRAIYKTGEAFLEHFFPDQWGDEDAQVVNKFFSAL